MSTAQEHLDQLPPDLARSFDGTEMVRVMAMECDRVYAALEDVHDQYFVQTATWGLDLWEQQLSLPVAPAGLDYPQRRSVILGRLQGRRASSRKSYADAVLSVAPASRIEYDYANSTIRVRIGNYDPTLEARVESLLAKITPAHLNHNAEYGQFIAGVSEAGDTL